MEHLEQLGIEGSTSEGLDYACSYARPSMGECRVLGPTRVADNGK